MTTPRRFDLSHEDTVQQIWELQRVAYTVEAELIGHNGIPPRHVGNRLPVSASAVFGGP